MVFLNNKYQYGFSRHSTCVSGFLNNVSKGGCVRKYEATESEIIFGEEVIEFYLKKNLPVHYGRVDFIKTEEGPTLTEAEFSCPIVGTIFEDNLLPFSFKFVNYVENCLV